MTDNPAGLRTRRAQAAADTEAALKDAAKRVFDRVGYLRAKITDITTEAGRAAGSFYSHFDSKDELLEALLLDILAEGHRRSALAGHDPDFSQLDAIRWHLAAYWSFLVENRAVMLALHQAAMLSEYFARRQRELMAPLLAEMAGHLEYVTAAGGRLPADPPDVAEAMVALMSGYGYSWLTEEQPRLTADEAVDMLARFILAGIMGPGRATDQAVAFIQNDDGGAVTNLASGE
jgi:AcrR family transcriptional regulator